MMARRGAQPVVRGGGLGRPLFVFGLGAAIIAAISGLVLVFYPYPALPTIEVESARTALTTARREAAELARQPLASATLAATTMERLYAVDRSRWFRFSRLESLDQAIAETQTLAEQAITQARQARADRLQSLHDLHTELDADLAVLAPDVQFLPPRETGARGAFARAELALVQAAGARKRGDLTLLESGLKTARTEVESIRETLGRRYERFNDPQWRQRWQSWADQAVAGSQGNKVTIIVEKLGKRLYVLRNGQVVAQFKADLGRNALSDKVSSGDGATPEGRYKVTERRANGTTRWYKALMLNYPNAEDLKAFQALRRNGAIPHGRGPGGLIEIHGHGGRGSNWTDGCVAVRDSEMDKLFTLVPVGTPVTIVGVARLPGDGEAPRNRT